MVEAIEADGQPADLKRHADGLEGVRFWPRAGARLIDLVVHYAVWIVATFLLTFVVAFVAPERIETLVDSLSRSAWPDYVLGLIGAILYHAIAEGLNGATLGKRIFSMVVIGSAGAPCTFAAGLIRSIAFYFDGLFFGLVAYMSMEPPYHQRHGDQWARTYVVRRGSVRNMTAKVSFVDALALALVADTACCVLMIWLKVS